MVLTGSRVALPGLVEIPMGPCWERGAINQGYHTITTVEGSSLLPGDMLDVS